MRSFSIELSTEDRTTGEGRVDIKAQSLPGQFLPVELKRQDNSQLWKAPETQLRAKYMRDTEACGIGIYLVFWFGNKLKIGGTSAERSGKNIQHPNDLKTALEENLAQRGITNIDVVVLDLSDPAPPNTFRAPLASTD